MKRIGTTGFPENAIHKPKRHIIKNEYKKNSLTEQTC